MFCKDELLKLARQSPIAVAAHDKAAWLGLFASDAEVHDPVGSRAHHGATELERFYQTFIAPNTIRFTVDHDLAFAQTVVRDVTISTEMGQTGLQVDVPLFIRYEFIEQQGQPKIHRLYAHWELAPMMSSGVFAQGFWRGCSAMLSLSRNMLKQQGLTGALGFSHAFVGLGRAAKHQCQEVLATLSAGQIPEALKNTHVFWSEEPTSLSQLPQLFSGCRWEKVLAGGRFVSARLIHPQWRGVVFFEIPKSQQDISVMRVFADNVA